MGTDLSLWILAAVLVLGVSGTLSIRIVQQYEGGVLLRFGRFVGVRRPGLNFILPVIDKMYRIDCRIVTMTVKPQEIITRDNVTIRVDAVVYFAVVDPAKAFLEVEDYGTATSQIALTTLRSVLGQSDLDDLLAHREEINAKLRQIIDGHTEPWGVRVTAVEVKDVLLPEAMQRAMAKQAEAEREKRAKVILAEGEFLASEKLAKAARVIAASPPALQLRYLQTVAEMAGERNSTIIPIPLEIFGALAARTGNAEPAVVR